jgi:hypothetical protein
MSQTKKRAAAKLPKRAKSKRIANKKKSNTGSTGTPPEGVKRGEFAKYPPHLWMVNKPPDLKVEAFYQRRTRYVKEKAKQPMEQMALGLDARLRAIELLNRHKNASQLAQAQSTVLEHDLDNVCCKVGIEKWAKTFLAQRITRTLTRITFVNSESKHGMSPLPKRATRYTEAKGIPREYVIQVKNSVDGTYSDHFLVAPSKVEQEVNDVDHNKKHHILRNKANMGLFAAKDFPAKSCLGIFLGATRTKVQNKQNPPSPYALSYYYTRPDGTEAKIVIDPKRPIEGTVKKGQRLNEEDLPDFFGIHMANDPYYFSYNTSKRATGKEKIYNIMVDKNLRCYAKRKIKTGQELYLHYNFTGTK